MVPLEISLPTLITVFGLVLSYINFRRGSDRIMKTDTRIEESRYSQIENIVQEIRADVKDIKLDLKDHSTSIIDNRMRGVEHEARIKSVEHRLANLESKENDRVR